MFDICLCAKQPSPRKQSCDDKMLRAATHFPILSVQANAGKLSKDRKGCTGDTRAPVCSASSAAPCLKKECAASGCMELSRRQAEENTDVVKMADSGEREQSVSTCEGKFIMPLQHLSFTIWTFINVLVLS